MSYGIKAEFNSNHCGAEYWGKRLVRNPQYSITDNNKWKKRHTHKLERQFLKRENIKLLNEVY